MEDLIRRSDAIKAITDISKNYTGKGKRDYHPHINFLVDALKYDVPTIEPKRGRWIPHKQENGKTVLWKCSECGQIIFSETETDRLEFQKWCSRCGADMRGKDDELLR